MPYSESELATKADLKAETEKIRLETTVKIETAKNELIKWYIGGVIAQILAIGYFVLRLTGKG